MADPKSSKTESEKSEKKITIDEATGSMKGSITLDENVVATIAGLAARDVPGVHSLGKSRLIAFGDDPTRGVEAEVGKIQAAFDIDVVIEYGCDIRKVASDLRLRVADEVNKMAGREVIEINIHVIDIKLPGKAEPEEKSDRVK